jgi:hypothetical protein
MRSWPNPERSPATQPDVAARFGLAGLGVMGLFVLSIRIENRIFRIILTADEYMVATGELSRAAPIFESVAHI